MSPKRQTVQASEWERHRQTIIRLYLEKPLTDVIMEMEMEHGFKASVNQFETQLRNVWGIRKNTKKKEWEVFFEGSNNVNLTAESMQTTPAGCKKSGASFKRAKRYVRQHQLPAPGQLPAQSLLPQHQPIHASPNSPDVISNFWGNGSIPPTLGSAFDFETALASLGTTLYSPIRTKLTSQVDPQGPMTLHPYDYSLFDDDTLGLDLDQRFGNNLNFPPNTTQPSPDPLHYNHPRQNFLGSERPLELERLNSSSSLLSVNSSASSNTQSSSCFIEFEKYLHAKGLDLASYDSTELAEKGLSLPSSFTLRFFGDLVFPKQQPLTRQASDLECAFRRLSAFVPGESIAVITQDQVSETKFIRILLFSMLNGFAGLNNIPIENILKFLGRIQFVNRSFLMILKDAPVHASRTFLDNIFRAAIEAKDERVLQQLLKYQLVDVNSTVCIFEEKRYTPVERAASLEAFNIIRILVDSGADVNKTHINKGDLPRLTGALGQLMEAVCSRRLHRSEYCPRIAATPEITTIVSLLIKAGTKVTMEDLTFAAAHFTNSDIAYRLSPCILPSHHQAFFQDGQSRTDAFEDEPNCPMMAIAQETDDDQALQIIQNMIDLCERDKCGECLVSSTQNVEWAAIEVAKRGHLRAVQLFINHLPSPTRIFSAAIRSKRTDLIDFVLSYKPELDPCAHYLEHSKTNGCTTPLAEAVRAGNEDLMNRLHAAGALDNLSWGDRLEPLIFAAARRGNMSYMQMLLSRANNSRHPYRPPGVAIHLALQNGHDDVAWLLLENGASVERGYKDRWSANHNNWFRGDVFDYTKSDPLRLALKSQNAQLVRAILGSDFKGHSLDYYFEKVLKSGDMSILSDFILAFPTMSLYGRGLSIFCMRCIKEDNINIFRGLIESVPSTDATSLGHCLVDAVKIGHSEMVSYLLDIGVNPFSNEVLKSALPDHPEMFQLLFDKGRERRVIPKCIGANVIKSVMVESLGDPKALDALLKTQAVNLITPEYTEDREDDALTPLGLAIVSLSKYHRLYPWMIKRLLQAGSDPNAVARSKGRMYDESITNYTGLMLAIETGRQDVVQLLIDHGANVNKKPYLAIRRTPLQYAAELGHLDIVRMLIIHGADVNGEPPLHSGGTALQFAATSGNCNIAAKLLNHGAQLSALPSRVNGRWPLEAAAEHGRLDMIQLLWNSSLGLAGEVAGFKHWHCLRAMNFARENGHMGCRDLISELSKLPVERLDVENYGAPWLAYDGQDRLPSELCGPEHVESSQSEDESAA